MPLPDDFLNVNLDALDAGIASKNNIRRKKSKSMAMEDAIQPQARFIEQEMPPGRDRIDSSITGVIY